MSVLGNQTSATPYDYFFEQSDGQVNILNISSLITNNIQLDDIQMDCGYIGPTSTPTLLLNGVPVASTSSFTSSIVSWSQYPALAPITYTGGGGVANFTNVNAATNISTLSANAQSLTVSSITGTTGDFTNGNFTNVSTATLQTSTINGRAYPLTVSPVISFSGASPISNGASYTVDMSGQAQGFYLLVVSIQSGTGLDPFTCSCVVTFINSNVAGGSFHMPSVGGALPTLAQSVSIQDNLFSSQFQVIIYSTSVGPNGCLGVTPQFSVYRIG